MPILKHRQSRRVAIVNAMILARTHGTKVAAYHCYRQGISIEAALYLLARRNHSSATSTATVKGV